MTAYSSTPSRSTEVAPYTGAPGAQTSLGSTFKVAALVAAHVPLALLSQAEPAFATFHAIAVFALGMWWAVVADRLEGVVRCAAYIAGAEVLWRMTQAQIFWEFGKYAIAALLGVATLRYLHVRRSVWLPITYFLLLTPSILVALQRTGLSGELRDQISFNLSGPLALAVAVIFFRQVAASWDDLRVVMWSVVAPAAGIATLALQGIYSAGEVSFTQESNFFASGGFGPNQVSGALGLAALLCIFLAVLERSGVLRVMALVLFLWFMGHSVLTFSRGGALSVVIALVLAAAHYVRAPGRRVAVLSMMIGISAVMIYVVVPRLDAFTGGALGTRFTTPETTRRGEIVAAELQVWRGHLVAGAGPGGAAEARQVGSTEGPVAHTEMTRLLAEHGMAGLAAIVLLLCMVAAAYRRALDPADRAWVAALTAWTLVEMGHSAMRLTAISLCFGLVMVTLQPAHRRWGRVPGSGP